MWWIPSIWRCSTTVRTATSNPTTSNIWQKHFRIASRTSRTYVDGSKITELWNSDRATLLAYALDDVRETEALSAVLSPSYFYQTQLLPLKYQNVIIRGNGTSLDALLTCEYLRKRHSLPLPEAPRRFSGALTRADATGIFRNVWHCDVRSLYPSIILAEKWVPSRDELGEFPRLLGRCALSGSRPKTPPAPRRTRRRRNIFRRCRALSRSRSTPFTAISVSRRGPSTTSTWPNGSPRAAAKS